MMIGNAYPTTGVLMQSFKNASFSSTDGKTFSFSSNSDNWVMSYNFFAVSYWVNHGTFDVFNLNTYLRFDNKSYSLYVIPPSGSCDKIPIAYQCNSYTITCTLNSVAFSVNVC